MKVALVCERFPVRSETFVLRQAQSLRASGVDLHVLTFREGESWPDPADAAQFEGRIRNLRNMRGCASRAGRIAGAVVALGRSAFGAAPGRRVLRAILEALRVGDFASARAIVGVSTQDGPNSYDAIVAHFGPIGVKANLLRRAGLLKGPLVVIFHGYDLSVDRVLRRHRKSYHTVIADAELLAPVSAFWRRRLIDLGASPGRLRVLRMGVDVDRAAEPDFSRPLNRPLRVLSVGRFIEKKGLRYAIEGVKRAGCRARLDIIGSGALGDELKSLASVGGGNPVAFLGSLSHAETLAAIGRADFVLLPSTTADNGDMEGVPVVLMEAMARGTVVISTHHGGIPELIDHGGSGFLIEERSPDQIAEILERLAAGACDLASVRRAAYAKILSEFDSLTLDSELSEVLSGLSSRELSR